MKTKKKRGHWPSFTMTELLISLAVYLIAMTGVVSLIAMSAGMLNAYSREYASRTTSVIGFKTLESLMNSSVRLTDETGGTLLITTSDGRNVRLSSDSNGITLRETRPDGSLKERKILIQDAESISLRLAGSGGRRALRVEISAKDAFREKYFLAAYLKNGDQTNENR